MEHSVIPLPPDQSALARLPAVIIADTIERLIAELDARERPLIEEEPMFPGAPDFVDLGDGLAGDQDDAEPEVDCCSAGDDCGGGSNAYFTYSPDAGPGDPADAEDNGDTEPNGDEGDYSR
jgi:hypothetical protein